MPTLPTLPTERDGVVAWVREHLGHLACDEVRLSSIRGGQSAADAALAALDLTGYASRRSAVLPVERRGATRLSPYIRHGLLALPTVWDAAADAPAKDRQKFRDELQWQEYARHLYARVGAATGQPLRFGPPVGTRAWEGEPWPAAMACRGPDAQRRRGHGAILTPGARSRARVYSARRGDQTDGARPRRAPRCSTPSRASKLRRPARALSAVS